MNNSKTPNEEMLEELERALPWAQDNMPPPIVCWMLEAILQGTPDVEKPLDVTEDDGECWRRSALYYLLSEDDFVRVPNEDEDYLKRNWLRLYRDSIQSDYIRNYKQHEKTTTDA